QVYGSDNRRSFRSVWFTHSSDGRSGTSRGPIPPRRFIVLFPAARISARALRKPCVKRAVCMKSPIGRIQADDCGTGPMKEPHNRVVQVERFGGPDALQVVDAALPTAGRGGVRVRVGPRVHRRVDPTTSLPANDAPPAAVRYGL